MTETSIRNALELQGLTNLAAVHHNLPTSFLYEEIVRRRGSAWTRRSTSRSKRSIV